MSSETLEKCYDVILTGNDMTSSLIAAAASRVGKKVLLVDCFDKGPRRFPREWSSIKLFELISAEVLLNQTGESFNNSIDSSSDENILKCHPSWILRNAKIYHSDMFRKKEKLKEFIEVNMRNSSKVDEFVDRFTDYYYSSLKNAKNAFEADKCLLELREEFPYFNSFSNNFTLDLTPRILQANGSLTDLFIKSNITRYLTFQKVSRLLTFFKQEDQTHKLMNVPCTRSDVFKCTEISLKEKRLLMKLLQHINNFEKEPEKFHEFESVPFSQFIDDFFAKQDQQTPKIIGEILLNSILMCDKSLKTGDALRQFSKFMSAIGRFTDRPYLVSDYGTDDVVQAFCRYSSVYGGIYCLDSKMNHIEIDSQNRKVISVELDGHGRLECEHLVSNYKITQLKQKNLNSRLLGMSRAITCSKKSILEYSEREFFTSFLYVPENLSGTVPVYIFETNISTHACTIGLHVQYYWSDWKYDNAEEDIKPVIERLFGDDLKNLIDKEQLLWCLFYNQDSLKPEYENIPSNLHIVSSPINEIDYDYVVAEAEKIFHIMYPDLEFFPQTKKPTGDDDMEDNENYA